ncbi:unnamed protein product [Rotaria sp. Silwood1]|nr:unnamed protein product [Rotaria sp. Silwood1]
MKTNLSTETLQTSLSLLIDRTTLWDNSSKNDDNKQIKCVAPLTDNAWQSISSLQDLIDSKYGLNTYKNFNNNEIIPWTNSDLQQLDNWIEQTLGKYENPSISSTGYSQQGNTFEHICLWEQQCQTLYNDINEAVKYLDTLHNTYTKVSYKTNSLYRACEQLLADQTKLLNITECIENRLSYFDDVDRFSKNLSITPLISDIKQLIPTLTRIDECLAYFDTHNSFKQSLIYKNQMKQVLLKALNIIKIHIIHILQNSSNTIDSNKNHTLLSDDAYTLFYGRFRINAPKVKVLAEELEQRCTRNPEYEKTLSDCHECYANQRRTLLTSSVQSAIQDLATKNDRDMCTLVRSGCAFLLHLCQDEYQLFYQFFSKHSSNERTTGLSIDPQYYSQIIGAKEQRISRLNSQSSVDSTSEVFFETIPGTDLSVISSPITTKDGQISSPADLHGMWYPTVRRTLVCLSKLFRCLDRNIFQGLSQETLTMCVQSLINASELIIKRKTPIDGRLFLIKHLLILREQIAPFNVDFAIKEMVIDFTKLKEAAMKFLSKKSKFLLMNRDNAFLEFLLQGTLQVKESFIDSKREVDKHLKQTCELYISDLTNQLCGTIRQYLQRSQIILKMNYDQNNTQKVSLRQQPFAKPEILHDIIIENYNLMKKQLPDIFNIMSLYLANKDTEQILFKPIKNNIQQAYQELIILIRDQYSEEDLQIIGCPSQEQISLLISTSSSK